MPPQPGSPPPSLTPDLAKLLYDGYQHQLRLQYEDAARCYRKILKRVPDHADVLQLLGIVRARQDRHAEAAGHYEKALTYQPNDPKAWYNLALSYGAMGQIQREVEAMERAFALDKTLPLAPNVLFPDRRARWDWRDHDLLLDHLRRGALGEGAPALPFLTLYLDEPGLQLAAARRNVAQEKTPAGPLGFDHSARRTASGPIRLAYLSADFRTHPVTHLVSQLLKRHDRARFEVTAISVGPDDKSEFRRNIMAGVDTFLDRETATPEAIAQEVAERGIDIFIDLMGHTKGERMNAFAHRPAPIQVEYLGHPGTSGAPYFDYVIGDAVVTPFTDAPLYSEKIVQLPFCYQPNDPDLPVAEPPTRAACGLPEVGFVFCGFNQAAKLDPDTFSSHMRILSAVPGAVLWMFAGNGAGVENLKREAERRGVDPARIVFAPAVPLAEHLARIALADLQLDTFPYTGHTTTSDALRMGVPVVTRSGRCFASRVAASLMGQMGIADLVTTDQASFEARAVALARDPAALADAKARLAAARPTSPLFDIDRYARHMERAYETMMARFRAGEAPTAFAVEP